MAGSSSGDTMNPVFEKNFLECAIFGFDVGCISDYVKHDEKGEYRTCGVCTAVYHKLVGLYGNPVDVNIYVNEHNIEIGHQMATKYNCVKNENNRIVSQIKKLQDIHVRNQNNLDRQRKISIGKLEKK